MYTAIIVFPYHSISINAWESESTGIEVLEEEAIEKMFELIPDITEEQKEILANQIIDMLVDLAEENE
jgi:hypothetical protein